MKRCIECLHRNPIVCRICKSYYRGNLMAHIMFVLAMLLAAMCLGAVMALVTVGLAILL